MLSSRRMLIAAGAVSLALVLGGCALSGQAPPAAHQTSVPSVSAVKGSPSRSPSPRVAPLPKRFRNPLPGMPPVVGGDIYSRTRAGMISPRLAGDPSYLYVPDSTGSTVTVIDQRTRRVVRVIQAGYLSQHVVPSWDLRKLIVNSSAANELVMIDPLHANGGRTVSVPRPYNLYFTPDGKAAVVMVEQHNTIQFSNPHTFRKFSDVSLPGCSGPNHADFSANGRYFVLTCEFSGELVKVSTLGRKVIDVLKLDQHATAPHAAPGMGMSMPQDIRLSPDGKTFYVADMGTNELRLIDAATFKQRRVIGMPSHPHGLYPSRNGKHLYISDRGAGEVSVLDFATKRIVDTWKIPGGGSPDMGGVSADGKTLWLSGRYNSEVYGFDTRTGRLIARIPVQGSPHGLAVWPQPGRYSLGHTGNMR
ncbi:MAG: YncE family protein [Actinomycetota bacterium]|nr:YncE family protein [Actinomycetota bacterium]